MQDLQGFLSGIPVAHVVAYSVLVLIIFILSAILIRHANALAIARRHKKVTDSVEETNQEYEQQIETSKAEIKRLENLLAIERKKLAATSRDFGLFSWAIKQVLKLIPPRQMEEEAEAA